MKKLSVGIITSLCLCGTLTAQKLELSLVKGWNLLGSVQTFTTDELFGDQPDIKFVWGYDNIKKEWYGYSPRSEIQELMKNKGYKEFDKAKIGIGYWVYSDKNIFISIGNLAPLSDENSTGGSTAGSTYDTGSDSAYYDDNYDVDNNITTILKTGFYNATKFELSDIANKTFADFYDEKMFKFTFNSDGVADFDNNWEKGVLSFSNGELLYSDENSSYTSDKYLKLALNDSGMVVLNTVNDTANDIEGGYVKVFLNPDVNTDNKQPIRFPITIKWWGNDYRIIRKDGIIEEYYNNHYNNYPKKVELKDDNSFVMEHISDEVNTSYYNKTVTVKYNFVKVVTKIAQIGDYDILKYKGEYNRSYIDEEVKGETLQDIIDNNITIFNYSFQNNKIVKTEDEDENVTYSVDDNGVITLHHCFDENKCDDWISYLTIEKNDGKVIEKYKYSYLMVSNPVVGALIPEQNTTKQPPMRVNSTTTSKRATIYRRGEPFLPFKRR